MKGNTQPSWTECQNMAVQEHSANEALCVLILELPWLQVLRVGEVSAHPPVPAVTILVCFRCYFSWLGCPQHCTPEQAPASTSILALCPGMGIWAGVVVWKLSSSVTLLAEGWAVQSPVPFPSLLQELQGSTHVAESLIIFCGSSWGNTRSFSTPLWASVSNQAKSVIEEKWGFQKAECWRSQVGFCWTATAPQGCNYRCTTTKWCVGNFCPTLFLLELQPCHSLLLKEAPVSNDDIQEPVLQLWPTTWWNPPATLEQLLTKTYPLQNNSSCCRQRPWSLCCHPQVVEHLYKSHVTFEGLSRKDLLVPLGKVLCCRLCLSSRVKRPAFQRCWVKWCC